jgi:hypothetical protein
MPSGDRAEGKAGQRARTKSRVLSIIAQGGPRPVNMKGSPGLDWYAANLEPRTFEEVADEIEYVGEVECLLGSVSSTANGGMTAQIQVLPAYSHAAVDLMQRSSQGVLVMVMFQAPWDLFAQDTPEWAHLAAPGDDVGDDDADQ